MPIAAASSFAAEQPEPNRFDNIVAMELAGQHCDSFQLFIDSRFHTPAYCDDVIEKIAEMGYTHIVIHLPNKPKLVEADLISATYLSIELGKQESPVDVTTLIHYEDDMQVDDVPEVNGRKVGIENSLTRFHPFEQHIEHVISAFELSRECSSAFVLDSLRFMYMESDEEDPSDLAALVVGLMDQLIPGRDIIHITGKTSWHLSFRDTACATNDQGDIGWFYMHQVQSFLKRGGTVVVEHEDLELGLQSLDNLRKLFEA